MVSNQCSPYGALSLAGTLSQTAHVPGIFGAGCAIPCTPSPATCLGLDAPRLDVTEGTGGAILASTPGPVLLLILPGALTGVAALRSIWGGRPAFIAVGEQCKDREGVRVQRRSPASSGSLPSCVPHARLHVLLQAPTGLMDALGRCCVAIVSASFL